jgi:predicted SnoaL-like aldol condensation-catalyzing enzyme
MGLQEDQRIVSAFYSEVVGRGEYAKLDSYVSPDYVDHNAPDSGRGAAVVREHMNALRRTFPDFRVEIQRILAEGDLVRETSWSRKFTAWARISASGWASSRVVVRCA